MKELLKNAIGLAAVTVAIPLTVAGYAVSDLGMMAFGEQKLGHFEITKYLIKSLKG